MENKLTSEELKRYNQIKLYTNNFSSKELENYENDIFASVDKKERAKIEYRRLKEKLRNDSDKYAQYLSEILEIEKLIKNLNIDSTIVNDISMKIVSIQIDIEQQVRLLSIIPKLQEELEYLAFLRRNAKKQK